MDKTAVYKELAALRKLADAFYSPGSLQRPFGPEGRGWLPPTTDCISTILNFPTFKVQKVFHKQYAHVIGLHVYSTSATRIHSRRANLA
jgi:hypothetical protein